ncbi:MAG: hypothetical protein JXQ73_14515 [Phycisphaerae bacterium]|nr:hypothetical protein [Phycisphaerae bacterium]
MRKLWFACVVSVMVMTSGAYADMTTFDFNALADGASPSQVSCYMTGLYGSSVTETDAYADRGDWHGNCTTYIWSALGSFGDFEISFDENPITGMSFCGYIFDATLGADFHVYAYTEAYGNRYLPCPVAHVYTGRWYGGDDTEFCSGWIEFDEPVTLLVFSNSGLHDVGIDCLTVCSPDGEQVVPAPGAALLGVLGLSIISVVRRRFA